jgi:hypothetical protein
VGHGESPGVWTSIEWAEKPSAGSALTAGPGESGSGLEAERVCSLRSGRYLFWEAPWSINYLWWVQYMDDVKLRIGPVRPCPQAQWRRVSNRTDAPKVTLS